jgi:short-subunit dehydrogenase
MTSQWKGKTYWLVGASEGLGRALAEKLSKAGATLCLSARNQGRLEELAAALPTKAIVAPCDVRDSENIAAAFARLPPLDGVIFNAGVYEPVHATSWDPDAVEAMCDVNFTGAVRVLGQVVPAMSRQGGGHIVLIGSLAAYRGLPGSIGYGASKAGLLHLAESLRIDLPRDRFKVQILNLGFIKTRLTEKNDFAMPFIMSPQKAAEFCFAAMEKRAFNGNCPWYYALGFRILNLLPSPLYFQIFR